MALHKITELYRVVYGPSQIPSKLRYMVTFKSFVKKAMVKIKVVGCSKPFTEQTSFV